jgi:hypothetical protein
VFITGNNQRRRVARELTAEIDAGLALRGGVGQRRQGQNSAALDVGLLACNVSPAAKSVQCWSVSHDG